MRKMFALQIGALLIVTSGLGGMLFFTDVYEDVHSGIVSILCLSCLKLEPETTKEYTFDPAFGDSHPNFVLDNLSKGPVFLHYGADACLGCEIMDPLIKQLFSIDFEQDEMVYKIVNFEKSDVVYLYNNIDHTSEEMGNSLLVYDKDNIRGLPMFSVVTLGYDHGIVKPYYHSGS